MSNARQPDGAPLPLDGRDPPAPDRYCDVVMKGGVVDGVVYPWAVMELARSFRFKNISGTSVGAVAAALTAAAEYSRRYGSDTGFNEVLLKVPEELAEKLGESTRLFSLFQPSPGAGQRLFGVFVALFGQGTWRSKWRAFFDSYEEVPLKATFFLLVAYLVFTVACAPHGGFVWSFLNSLFFVALVLGLAVGWMGWRLWTDLGQLVVEGFGMCSGLRADASEGPPAFTDWLHEGIQAAAGRQLDQPLTFRHLWQAPGGPPTADALAAATGSKPRSIDLRMVSTNLTHSRPYSLPWIDETSRLFFRLDELADYFPASVIKYLEDHSEGYVQRSSSDPPAASVDKGFLELPSGDLPVLVATRMSLSFPVLFKAVPLYAIDYQLPRETRRLRRCWFADGGISANFLIHQFDSLLPRWPTFGITLEPDRGPDEATTAKGKNPRVWVPRFHNQGRGDMWNRFDPGPDHPPAAAGKPAPTKPNVVGFLSSLLDTMMDWNDNTTMRMAGTRDRVARLKLKAAPGSAFSGLNLKISGAEIMRMARDYGRPAGLKLVAKFGPGKGRAGFVPAQGWSEHRWVRFHGFVTGLRERMRGFEAASERSAHSMPLSQQIQAAVHAPPLSGDPKLCLSRPQAKALEETRQALVALEKSLAQSQAVQGYQPLPTPEMRLRMPL